MNILSQKLQVRILCDCNKKFTKVYAEGQINTREDEDCYIKYVYAGCPKCKEIKEVILFTIQKNEQV